MKHDFLKAFASPSDSVHSAGAPIHDAAAQQTTSRYPYTYACDFVRQHCTDFNASVGIRTPTISRSEASQVMHAFEKVFGLTHEQMAEKLADAYLSAENLAAPQGATQAAAASHNAQQDEQGEGP